MYHIVTHGDICKYIYTNIIKNNEKLFWIKSNLQAHYPLKLDFPKEDQPTRGKWLIHEPKHPKKNQSQSLELLYTIS